MFLSVICVEITRLKPAKKERVSVEEFMSTMQSNASLDMFYRGPCHNYMLDMSSNSFGVCVCGYSKEQHLKNQAEDEV